MIEGKKELSAHEDNAPRKLDIIGAAQIGGTGGKIENRTVGVMHDVIGTDKFWDAIVDRWILPAYEVGFRRILLHNPGGTLPNEDMQLDQFLHAERTAPWLLKNFEKAFSRVPQDMEIISYLGTPAHDNDFKSRISPKLTDNWLYRMWDSLRLPMGANHSIGWDAGVLAKKGDPVYDFMCMVQNLGHKGYIEGWPEKGHEYHFDWPIIVIDSFYYHVEHDLHHAKNWAATPPANHKEIIRWLAGWPTPYFPQYPNATWDNIREWIGSYIKTRWKEGHSVIVPMHPFIDGEKQNPYEVANNSQAL